MATELLDQMAFIYLFFKGKGGEKKARCKLESPFLVIEQKNKGEKKLILSSSRCYMIFICKVTSKRRVPLQIVKKERRNKEPIE